jgi:hypothetical protein
MSKVKIENLSRKEALELLENVQKNHAKGHAIQGKQDCRWINTRTVNATVKPQKDQFGDRDDYSKNTFEIYSNYWQESTLREFAEI